MEIHKPKSWHGWREFLKEYGIIVVGVLTALAAEQLVESLHSDLKVRRAEAAMRLELAENDGAQAYARVLVSNCLEEQIKRVHDGAGKLPPEELRKLAADYTPPYRTWDSEAWRVVVASDTGTSMGPDRLVAWSSPYRMMPYLTEANEREAQLVVDLRETLPPMSAPSSSDLQSLRRIAAQLRLLNRRFSVTSELLLARIGSLQASVPVRIQQQLVSDARALYGQCVRVPDLSATAPAQRSIANLRSPVLGSH